MSLCTGNAFLTLIRDVGESGAWRRSYDITHLASQFNFSHRPPAFEVGFVHSFFLSALFPDGHIVLECISPRLWGVNTDMSVACFARWYDRALKPRLGQDP